MSDDYQAIYSLPWEAGGGVFNLTMSLNSIFNAGGDLRNPDFPFHPLELFEFVDVIYAVDRLTNHRALVYCRADSRGMALSILGMDFHILCFEVDRQGDDLSRLIAVIESVRGGHSFTNEWLCPDDDLSEATCRSASSSTICPRNAALR